MEDERFVAIYLDSAQISLLLVTCAKKKSLRSISLKRVSRTEAWTRTHGSSRAEIIYSSSAEANVIFIEMGERHDIVVVALRLLQVRSQFHRQVSSNIVFVISAASCCVIEEKSSFQLQSRFGNDRRSPAEKTSPCAFSKTCPKKLTPSAPCRLRLRFHYIPYLLSFVYMIKSNLHLTP